MTVNNLQNKIKHNTVVFGGGCFWCTEAVFKSLRGVASVLPGYAGGMTENPTYEDVSSGKSGHAEVIRIEYDPGEIKLRDLLTVFFASHDPTTLNRQGNDVGTQYRSVVFYTTDAQKRETEEFIKELNGSNAKGDPIVTETAPLDKFYEAEDHHKSYYENNKGSAYCQIVINPKLEKVQKEFAALIKNNS